MADCTKIVICNNQLTALEVFLKTIVKLSTDCPAVQATLFDDAPECSSAACDRVYDLEEIIKSIGITENENSLALSVSADDLEERVDCNNIPSLLTLFNEAFTEAEGCQVLHVAESAVDDDCTDIPCNGEDLLAIITKSFMKVTGTGCTVILITKVNDEDGRYAICNGEDEKTVARKLLIPSTTYPGHYAWVINNSNLFQLTTDACTVTENEWNFKMLPGSMWILSVSNPENYQTFDWFSGAGTNPSFSSNGAIAGDLVLVDNDSNVITIPITVLEYTLADVFDIVQNAPCPAISLTFTLNNSNYDLFNVLVYRAGVLIDTQTGLTEFTFIRPDDGVMYEVDFILFKGENNCGGLIWIDPCVS